MSAPTGDPTAAPSCVEYRPGWVVEPDRVFAELRDVIGWEQHPIRVHGRTLLTPRLTAWIGDAAYTYSGVTNHPQPWPAALATLRDRLHDEFGVVFDSCLANLYRDGRDSMGYHSDDEPELGPRPVIASASLGARRRFALRHRETRRRWTWELGAGDLLLMRDDSQSDYAHAVPKTARDVGPRMNLTFRRFAAG